MKLKVFEKIDKEDELQLALKLCSNGVVLCAVDEFGQTLAGGKLLCITEKDGLVLLSDLAASLRLPLNSRGYLQVTYEEDLSE